MPDPVGDTNESREIQDEPMTVDQLKQMQRAQPFRPYRIHLADGRHLDVEHPDFLARSPTGRTVIVYKLDESFEIVDLLLVCTLEVLNGERRAQRE